MCGRAVGTVSPKVCNNLCMFTMAISVGKCTTTAALGKKCVRESGLGAWGGGFTNDHCPDALHTFGRLELSIDKH